MKQILTIENLSCQNCRKHVSEHISSLAGVSEVVVDLESKRATVETDRAYSQADYQASLGKTIYKVVALD